MIMNTVRREPFLAGWAAAGGALGPGGAGRVRVSVGSIVVAMGFPQLVQCARCTDRAGERDSRCQRSEPRINVCFTRANQIFLRVDHFDVAGDTGLKPLARLGYLFGGQLQPLPRDHLLRGRGTQIEQCPVHIGGHLLPQILDPHVGLLRDRALLGEPAFATPAIQHGQRHLHAYAARADRVGELVSAESVVGCHPEARQAFRGDRGRGRASGVAARHFSGEIGSRRDRLRDCGVVVCRHIGGAQLRGATTYLTSNVS